jgi:hypothetical protein
MKIIVLTTYARRDVTGEHLTAARLAHTNFVNPAWDAPPIAEHDYLNPNPIGAYRCWKGHQTIWSEMPSNTLVLEDDAIPSSPGVWETVRQAERLLSSAGIVSLHIRSGEAENTTTTPEGWTIAQPRVFSVPQGSRHGLPERSFEGRWALGSLCYWISPQSARELAARPWDGTPVDLLIANAPGFVGVYAPDLFVHDRTAGSLVESAT